MSWFQLDAASIAERTKLHGTRSPPSLAESLLRGTIGFTIISVAGFAPWALAGRRLHEAVGEAGLYAVCALVFIGLSGPLLHRLIIGPNSLPRFYKLFGIAFSAYAVAWTAAWMLIGGHKGSLIGLFIGTAVMGWMFARAFAARGVAWKIILVLFVGNALGYFIGGWAESTLSSARTHPTLDKLSWGVCYGIGLGAALGVAFHWCQSDARKLLRRTADTANSPE